MQPPNSQLLRSLGRLARGLSALFWGLPLALLVCVETAHADWLRPAGGIPAMVVTALIVYGLWQMAGFQPQERPWRQALDRAQLLALVLLGLCPFIYWHSRMPEQFFFAAAVWLLQLTSVIFLFNLNLVLKRLGAMLPDETLRLETRQFTAFNRGLLVALLFYTIAVITLSPFGFTSPRIGHALFWLSRCSNLLLVFFVLLPLAMTMSLIWKTKEVILDAVFGPR